MTKRLLLIIPALLLALATGGYFYINAQVEAAVDARIDEFLASGDYQVLEYDSVRLTLRGEILLDNLHVIDDDGNDYLLDHIRVSELDLFNATPHHLLLTATGMHFPAGLPAFGNGSVRAWRTYLENAMEGDYLPVEIRYRYTFNPDDAARLDNDISVSLPGGFHLSSISTFHNLDLAAPDPGRGDTTTALQDADIPSATLALRDMGMVEDMLAIQGQDAGLDGEQYRQQLLAQLQTMVMFAPRQLQGMAQDYLVRFAEFLEGDKTLQVSIEPEFGGNVRQLQGEILGAFYIGNFSRIADLLHLEVETLP